MSSQYPELLADMAFKVCMFLADRGVPAQTAQAASRDLAEHVRGAWGGQSLYVRRPQESLFDAPDPPSPGGRSGIIADIEAVVDRRLAAEVGPTRAVELARAVAGLVESDWAGTSFYIPQGRDYDVDRLKHEIFNRFDGTNREQLSREFGISNVRIYQICAEMRARAIFERNLRLFESL
jgi:Mor family transcriptional regulator